MASTSRRLTRTICILAGVAAILIGWQLLSLFIPPVYVASPAASFRALGRLAWGSTLWVQVLITLKRLVIGLAVGAAAGWVLGIAAGLDARVRAFLEPIRWVGMTIPVVIVAGLAALWFGLGDFTVMVVVGLIVLPTM